LVSKGFKPLKILDPKHISKPGNLLNYIENS